MAGIPIFRQGERVAITCQGESAVGTVAVATGNGQSLAVALDSGLAGHFAFMPILFTSDGQAWSAIDEIPVTVTRVS